LVLAALLITTTGCGLVDGAGRQLDVEELEGSIERNTGIELQSAPELDVFPGIPSLASTRAGASGARSITVLEFFNDTGPSEALGDRDHVGPYLALTRDNVVVLYSDPRDSPEFLEELTDALDSAPTA
jgi:hypothetical protein